MRCFETEGWPENWDLAKALDIAERVAWETGYQYGLSELRGIFNHTIRKCQINGQGIEYSYILLEDELRQHLMRLAINVKGELNHYEQKRRQSACTACL